MFTPKAIFGATLLCILLHAINAESAGLPLNRAAATSSSAADELNTCEEQLSKYRKFLLQAIISFEDVCDAYSARPQPLDIIYHSSVQEQDGMPLPIFHNYQPPEQRSEIWAFFKLLMAQFNDLEFTNVIHDAVIERCKIKSQQQRDEKRNSVVLGKKQRFHSWGGKRAPLQMGGGAGVNAAAEYFF